MAEAILRIETEYSLTEAGILLPRPGVAMAVIGQVVTEHFRAQLESSDVGVQLAPNDGVILVSPHVVISAARQYIKNQTRVGSHQEGDQQDLPRLILPGSLQA